MDLLIILLIGVLNFIVVSLFTLSGGIGLIMRPIMLFLGVPPLIMIGTARTSAIPGNIVAQIVLNKAKKIDWKLVALLAVPSVFGGLLGIFIITSLNDYLIKQLIGIALLVVGTMFLVKKDYGLKHVKPHLGKLHMFISVPLVMILGVLLVLVGGIGPIARLLYIFGYGKTHIEAAAIQKAINFWQTIITAVFFAIMMYIDWILLLVLMVSSTLGNYIGARFVLKKGEKYLRMLLILVVFVSAIKLIFFL